MGVYSSALRKSFGALKAVDTGVLYPLFYGGSGSLDAIVSGVMGALEAVGDAGYAGGALLGVMGMAAEVEILTAAADHLKGVGSFVSGCVSDGESFVFDQWHSFLAMCESFIDRVECFEDAVAQLKELSVKAAAVVGSGVLAPAGAGLVMQAKSTLAMLEEMIAGLRLSCSMLLQSVRQGGFGGVLGVWESEDVNGETVVDKGAKVVLLWLDSAGAIVGAGGGLVSAVGVVKKAVYGIKLPL